MRVRQGGDPTFIGQWQALREPDAKKAEEKTAKLLKALKEKERIAKLAPNALLLTMIVREHFSGGGSLPDTRAQLYAKCSETLLKGWIEAKDDYASPLDSGQKEKFLGRLAYSLQDSDAFDGSDEEVALTLPRVKLEKELRAFLKEEVGPQATNKTVGLVERLSAKDAMLVNYGNDQFGFVHRTFQEYFAAWHLVQEEPARLREMVFEEPPGWNETLYLAVAQMLEADRRKLLVELVERSRVLFALACLESSGKQAQWLQTLIPFLARRYWEHREHRGITAADCAAALDGRRETKGILEGLFRLENRQGPVLVAAVELAEELARNGDATARAELAKFWAEAATYPEDWLDAMVPVGDGVFLDKYLVTNVKFERMVPGRRAQRDEYSSDDLQPVIYVNRYEAELYCRWRGGGSGRYRLPSEEEWLRGWGDGGIRGAMVSTRQGAIRAKVAVERRV
ncbi:MAG: SUMF1/EgtB/PvdO family nonheme iron enzyme [Bryobacteraceae bacterium]